MIAAIYDWSGFYIGVNGGWRLEPQVLGPHQHCRLVVSPALPKAATTQPAAPSVVRSAIAGRPASWVFGLEAQGDWADFSGSQRQPDLRRPDINQFARSMRSACSPARSATPGTTSCSTSRAAPRSPATSIDASSPAPARLIDTRRATPAGAARSAPASNTASRRTGRSASNTTTCSWARTTSTSPTPAGRFLAQPTASVRTSISVTVRVNYRWGGPVIAKY